MSWTSSTALRVCLLCLLLGECGSSPLVICVWVCFSWHTPSTREMNWNPQMNTCWSHLRQVHPPWRKASFGCYCSCPWDCYFLDSCHENHCFLFPVPGVHIEAEELTLCPGSSPVPLDCGPGAVIDMQSAFTGHVFNLTETECSAELNPLSANCTRNVSKDV